MEEILKEIAGIVGYIALILFGHAGLWSVLVSVVSGLVAIVAFITVFFVSLPIARSKRLGGWPARAAKTVLGVQALIMAWIIAAVVGVVCQEKWGASLVSTMIPTFVLAFAAQIALICRIRKKGKSSTEPSAPPLPRAPQTGHSEGAH